MTTPSPTGPTDDPAVPPGANPLIYGPLLGWWRRKSIELGRLPSRADLRPEDLSARTLPHVVLMEISPGAERLRFRLFGSAHVAFNQRDFTGLYLDEAAPKSAVLPYMRGLYLDMMRERRPLWSVNFVRHPRTDQRLIVRRMMLPLSSNGDDIDMCLGAQTFDDAGERLPREDNPWHSTSEAGEQERRFL